MGRLGYRGLLCQGCHDVGSVMQATLMVSPVQLSQELGFGMNP